MRAQVVCALPLQALYEGARDMGWSDAKKRAQLTAPEARLLVVTGKVGIAVPNTALGLVPPDRWVALLMPPDSRLRYDTCHWHGATGQCSWGALSVWGLPCRSTVGKGSCWHMPTSASRWRVSAVCLAFYSCCHMPRSKASGMWHHVSAQQVPGAQHLEAPLLGAAKGLD